MGEGAAVGVTVGDGAGVVGRGTSGLSGTQTPPPPSGTWPAGHGSAAAAVAIVNTLTTTADHNATMPKTFRPVPTPYNATQLSEETRGPLQPWLPGETPTWAHLTGTRKRGRQ